MDELPIACRDCATPIEPYIGAYDILPPERVAELMVKAYGRVLCPSCRLCRTALPKVKRTKKGGS